MAVLATPVLLVAILGTFIVFFWGRLRSAVASIPGPTLTLFSSLPLRYQEFRGNRTRYIHDLHLKYGSVVRIAPNEITFASLEAMKEIYMSNGSGYDKTEFYSLFKQYNTGQDAPRYSAVIMRRRLLADRYANSNVVKEKAIEGIQQRSRNFTAKAAKMPNQEMDIYVYLHCYAFDCVTHHLFHPYGSNSIDQQYDESIMREVSFDTSLARRLIQYYTPNLEYLADLLGLLPPIRTIPKAQKLVLDAVGQGGVADFTPLSRLQDPKLGLEEIQMAAECMDHMVAGIETTGDVLCWLMWQISLPGYQAIQDRLYAELTMDSANGEVSYDQLPYLHAVLKEGLRIFPSIPMSLPRYVPKGGRDIAGTWLPEGIIVSCQPYTMNRFDQVVFPEPDTFVPERWLDKEVETEQNRLFFTFSNGGRGCIGRHLAMVEMKLLLRDVYSTFRTVLTEEGMTADMSMADQIISSRPKAQKCMVKFIPR
ncbi:benzoate 4-monooxygenase cytochrome p450 [Grosmannia clavigera kw1407]|uniref:Benzoate 4-monooxygenase cytochrome p450 n=1 Tax=Grosmannia clavigera (strain kw1407 / UAMH 11150) TaxID=655863 RepID=F0X9S3_GROCL|nr:benzoate 4-monooxygenase cytochrome p450 [Grosmannia clavigera kw1407]EFX05326.1 benzoate 4-monooxygenase cytochrome p450 [Grosmannia clavigera kw1407]